MNDKMKIEIETSRNEMIRQHTNEWNDKWDNQWNDINDLKASNELNWRLLNERCIFRLKTEWIDKDFDE